MRSVQIDLSKGIHTRTRFEDGKLRLITKPFGSTFPGDTEHWFDIVPPGVASGDRIVVENTEGVSWRAEVIQNLKQTPETMSTVFLRLKAIGEGITDSIDYSDYGMRMIVTLSDDGLGGEYEDVTLTFPSGTWGMRQFEISYTPTKPVHYVYVYVYAGKRPGKLTFWDVELADMRTTSLSPYGRWESEVVDLRRQLAAPVAQNNLPKLNLIGFSYQKLEKIMEMDSIEFAQSYFEKFDMLVIGSPLTTYAPHAEKISPREYEIINHLIAKGVKLYGYLELGWDGGMSRLLNDAEMKAHLDAMAARGYFGVFYDIAGWDYDVTRERMNTYVDYAHSKGLSCFMNAWNQSDILSDEVHPVYNPNGTPPLLGPNDWILLESFFSNGRRYIGDDDWGWENWIEQWYARPIRDTARPLGVKVAALSYTIPEKGMTDTTDRDHAYTLAMIVGADGWSGGDLYTSYNTLPDVKYGNQFTGNIERIGDDTWVRKTDVGEIYFRAHNSKVESGAYATAGVNFSHIQKDKALIRSISAKSVKLTWYTSPDVVSWKVWTDGKPPERYVKVAAELFG